MAETLSQHERMQSVRLRTTETLAELTGLARRLDLPPAPVLERMHEKLAANSYQILVVGEAKRGKSTFINALIGRDLLPTDVDVATCQVFRVQAAERLACRLRFEDGSAQEIGLAELPRYGSQALAADQAPASAAQALRWIEVEVPVKFLPEGVSLLDTPGLGSLHAAHCQMTRRFLPHADAVIFVLDSAQPLTQVELDLLQTIVDVTTQVFFIQTRIDQYRRPDWEEVQRRNEQLLRERFGEWLADLRVWPISSKNLRQAAQTGDADYLAVSRHRELARALRGFLFRTSGWSRVLEALLAAEHYHRSARQTLAGRQVGLQEGTDANLARLQQAATAHRQQFEANWGGQGSRRKELLGAMQREVHLSKQYLQQVLQFGGAIETAQRERIAAVGSIEAAQQLLQTLSADVFQAAEEAWREVCSRIHQRGLELLKPFLSDAEALQVWQAEGLEQPALAGCALEGDYGWFQQFKLGRCDALNASYLVGLPLGLLVAVSAVSLPVAGLVVAGAGLWGFLRGFQASAQTQLRGARQECLKHLNSTLIQARRYFLGVDHQSGRFSLVDETCGAAVRAVSTQVEQIATQQSQAAKAELARLKEQAQLDQHQRRARAEELQQQLSEWDRLGQTLEQLRGELKSLITHSAVPIAQAS